MYKLINQGTPIIHDFAHRMYWGHNIEGSNNSTMVEFADGKKFQKFYWDVFNFLPINVGDLILRNMSSGNIGVYECVKRIKNDFIPSGNDLYSGEFIFCGYYDKKKNMLGIFNGYGIPKPFVVINNLKNIKVSVLTSVLLLLAISGFVAFVILYLSRG